jgi:HK97 family phage major capsid protein
MSEAITQALREHAEKIEQKAATDRAALLELKTANEELLVRVGGLEQDLVATKDAGFRMRGAGGPSPVTEFVKSPKLADMINGAPSTGRVHLKGASIRLLTKAVVSSGRGGVGDDGYVVAPERDVSNLWGFAQRPLFLFDALPTIPVSSSSYAFTQLDPSYSNAADYQTTEGTQKPESGFPTVDANAAIATVAHWIPVSNQVLADAPSLEVQLSNLLSFGVRSRAENQILNGVGGTGKIHGLIPQATAYAATANDPQDRVGEAVTALAAAGWVPGLVVMNPVDWGAIQRTRGETEGAYLLGSPLAPAAPVLWNTPVVTSASMPAGTALVLDPSQVALLDREQVSVQASREAQFTSNVTILLAEGRLGLAVFSPSAVLSVALTPTT